MNSRRSSQDALDAFVTTQLIDNGMDVIAKKINRLYVKLQRTQGDDEAQKKYAKQLHHYLTLSCRLLAKQRDDVSACINTIESDLKRGVLEGAKGVQTKDSQPSTPLYARPGRRPSVSSTVHTRDVDGILPPGRHVAAKVARSHELWILACVVRYDHFTRTYEVEDMDTPDEETTDTETTTSTEDSTAHTTTPKALPPRRHHIVPRDQVKPLPAETLPADGWIHYSLNQPVMAIYPNTTSFYRAVVRVPNPTGAPYVLVRFDDDADEFGSSAPDRKIPFRYVLAVDVPPQ